MSTLSPDPQSRDLPGGNMPSGHLSPDGDNGETSPPQHADLSAWLIWAVLVLIAMSSATVTLALRNKLGTRLVEQLKEDWA